MKKKKNKGPFDDMQNAAVGFAGLGVTTAVGAGVGAHAPAGSPSVTQGFNTLAGFTPVLGTAIGGRSVLKQIKKYKKKKGKYV